MKIAQHKRLLGSVFAVTLIAGLFACGGGGGDPGTPTFTANTGTTTGDTTGGGTTPVTPTATASQASSIAFVSAAPAGTALAVSGTGGNGRTEIGSLTFKVVSAAGIPVNGATVNFSLNTATDATLPAASGVTGSTGEVSMTVQSGVIAGPIVVVATVAGVTGVTTQSDSIQVSNGLAIAAGFELVAEKYNLDGGRTGDTTNLTIFARDSNGNPVADGLAVSFTTDFGVVATSTLGGCTTVNGTCSAAFRVQEPRGTGLATVTARALVQGATTLTDQITINMASATGYGATRGGGSAVSPVLLAPTGCSQSLELFLSDGQGRSVAAGTTITVEGATPGVSPQILQGATVPDQLAANFPPNRFTLQVSSTAIPAVGVTPASCTTGSFKLAFTTPSGRLTLQDVAVNSVP